MTAKSTRYNGRYYQHESYKHKETDSEREEREAFELGRDYIEGRKSIHDVEKYLNSGSHYPLTRTQVHKAISAGVAVSEAEGKAKASRVQPEQESISFGPKYGTRKKGKGQLASRPEHTRWKPATAEQKHAGVVARHEKKRERAGTKPYAAKPGARNEYDVKAQRKKDLKILLDKHAKGMIGVKEVKTEAKIAAEHKAYKNIVYNETHHRYVGSNRIGSPPKKEWDYQPKRRHKKT